MVLHSEVRSPTAVVTSFKWCPQYATKNPQWQKQKLFILHLNCQNLTQSYSDMKLKSLKLLPKLKQWPKQPATFNTFCVMIYLSKIKFSQISFHTSGLLWGLCEKPILLHCFSRPAATLSIPWVRMHPLCVAPTSSVCYSLASNSWTTAVLSFSWNPINTLMYWKT